MYTPQSSHFNQASVKYNPPSSQKTVLTKQPENIENADSFAGLTGIAEQKLILIRLLSKSLI